MNTPGTREGEDVEERGRARQELRAAAREGTRGRYYHSYFTGKETKAQSGTQLAQVT